MPRRRVHVSIAIIALVLGFVRYANAGAPVNELQIHVLSNRADLISGGDALVEVDGATDDVQVTAAGRDVTSSFRRGAEGQLIGVVTGLPIGRSDLTARLRDGRGAVITLDNHPLTGPVFSGAQTQPWRCDTEPQGLGPSTPPLCEAPTQVTYFYRSSDPTKRGWQAYDPSQPAADVAETTTTDGLHVPFIVRQELGTINRSIYGFAVLWDPERTTPSWASPTPWNSKVFYAFGGGGATSHHQGQIFAIGASSDGDKVGPETSTDFPSVLALGYAVATASLGRGEYNMNDVTAAETTMMVKEHLSEVLGRIKFTISWGCSGGSINQNLISAAYPGLLDGIQTPCSVVDWYTTGMNAVDCNLLVRYFDNTSPQLWALPPQREAVDGSIVPSYCIASAAEPLATDWWYQPTFGCFPHLTGEGDPPWVYNPDTNPTGVRCTMMDDQSSIFGQRAPERWGPVEKKIGYGFAPRPLDNVGVQYGLEALLADKITPEQFVDLNENVGGYDIDYNWVPNRMSADPEALTIGYRTGRIPVGNTWSSTPMIDQGGNGNYDIHADVDSYVVRARITQENGNAANQVIWKHATGGHAFDLEDQLQSLDLMDRWLTAVNADNHGVPLAEKVALDKPADAVDKCVVSSVTVSEDPNVCAAVFPHGATPRIAAGGPLTNNVIKCQLKPLRIEDYNGTVPAITAAQFDRLTKVFPDGVCDWSKPGVGFSGNVPWMSFATGPGGAPLGPAPVSVAVRLPAH